ncbi:chemotaxis protein CheW [Novosphingobium sp. FSY-8]|uniref:Chemotaxis protein CheW n=1 Tax=Novosphingobium ovatum TaxID=1908523 RepID=A0ABW9XA54_9SPHN|nr:chemotaxis protein CheW [Novosphingobium ovatum]NBC35412.1 chemotaxis protein CheW [Novosphingobium ovatum]
MDKTVINWAEDGTLEALTFDIGGETFALEATLVREILDPLPVTHVPGSEPLVGAVVNFRGRVIPLADLRMAFGMAHTPPGPDARIVVIEINLDDEPVLIGLSTDRVNEVTSLSRQDAEPPPELGLSWPRENVRTMVRRAGDVLLVPDLVRIFGRCLKGAGDTADFALSA